MRLSKLCKEVACTAIWGDLSCEVSEVVYDSRKACKGCLFVCIRGARADGHRFIDEAISRGARALIIERWTETLGEGIKSDQITIIQVEDSRKALARIAAQWFGKPAEKLITIGVTGTKGKTTTTYLIQSILQQCGIPTGLIGTIEIQYGERTEPSCNTTPESYILHQTFARMLDAGMRAVVMEVSSQAMMQSRTEGIVFDYGIFTNLSEDHIGPGEHTCFDEYLACKRKLFRQCRVGIVNADDPCVDEIIRAHTCELITYGCCEDAKIRAVEIEQSLLNSVPGVKFRVRVRETEGEQATEGERATEGEQAVAKEGAAEKSHVFPVMFPMPGYFSVYNALCAITLSKELNLDEDETCKALLRASVKGRVERVPISEDFCVLIDYAHNAMALESLLTSLREYSPKRLVCLFGCGGNRSRERRFQMGEVSGKLADLTIVTSDNPRYEDPQSIIDDIKTGLEKTKGKYIDIIDRRQAIEYCLCQAREGDMIVIAGKGHETYQETGGRRIPMDDRKIIEEYMRKNRKGTP